MGALSRPDLPPGALRDLNHALHELHHTAGWPSLRTLAKAAGCSPTTVSKVFTSPTLPSWGTLELLVEELDGDTTHFHQLWLAASTPTNGTAPAAPRIAGRRAELAAVRRHLETGTGLLLITGEAGIGKTTLLTAATADTDVHVARGHCLPLSTEAPLMPVGDALRSVLSLGDDLLADGPPHVRRVLSRLLPELAAEDPGDGDVAMHHLFSATRFLLEAAAVHQPVGLVLEDVHWADPATLDLLEHLLATGAPVPVLATWRSDDPQVDELHRDWLLRMGRLPSTCSLGLRPLSERETAEQLSLLVAPELDQAWARQIHARSGGLPLFTAQLATHDEHGLPGLLEDVLARRLVGLDPDGELVTATLGAAGRGLTTQLLCRATGLDETRLEACLRTLSDARLVQTDLATAALSHPLLCEAARLRQLPGGRQRVHRALAMALADDPDPEATEVARHWQAAGEADREREWRVRAARAARARLAARLEVVEWERALELWEDAATITLDLDRVDAQLALITALDDDGREDLALERSLALLASDEPTDEQRFEACFEATSGLQVQRSPEDALAMLEGELVPLAASVGRSQEIQVFHANLLASLGRLDEAQAVSDAALAQARRSGPPRELYRALVCSSWHTAVGGGDLATGLSYAEEARSAFDEAWGKGRLVGIGMMVTDALLIHSRPADEVAEAGREALTLLGAFGMHSLPSQLVRDTVTQALLLEGRVAEAKAVLGQGGADLPAGEIACPPAWLLVLEGRPEEAAEALSDQRGYDFWLELVVCEVLAEALLWSGRPRAVLDRVIPVLDRLSDTPPARFATSVLLLATRAAADADEAHQSWRDRLISYRGGAMDPLGPGVVPGHRTAATAAWECELARLTRSDSAEQWVVAANQWERLLRRHDAAYCRWRGAQAALRDRQGTLAARLLKRAAVDAREHVPLTEAIAKTRAALS